MTVNRVLYCDRDGCPKNGSDQYPGWLTLSGEGLESHFCNMDCVMQFAAANSEPPTVIRFDALGASDE